MLTVWIENAYFGRDLKRSGRKPKKLGELEKRKGLGTRRNWSSPHKEVVYGGLWSHAGDDTSEGGGGYCGLGERL